MILTEITDLVHDLVDTNATTFPSAKMFRFLNKNQTIIVNQLLANDSLGQYDDRNNDDLNEGYINIESGRNDYNFAEDENLSDILYITKVLCKDSNGQYQVLHKIGPNDDLALNELKESSSGAPTAYRISGKVILLNSVPNYAKNKGLKLLFVRIPVKLLSSDMDVEPGIPATYHPLLALKTAYDYARAKRMDNKDDLLAEVKEEEANLEVHVSGQDKDVNTVMTTAQESLM